MQTVQFVYGSSIGTDVDGWIKFPSMVELSSIGYAFWKVRG